METSNSIHNTCINLFYLEYSNRAGSLFFNTQQGIELLDIDEIDKSVRLGKMVSPHLMIKDGGWLFLSPEESHLCVLNERNIRVFKLDGKVEKVEEKEN